MDKAQFPPRAANTSALLVQMGNDTNLKHIIKYLLRLVHLGFFEVD